MVCSDLKGSTLEIFLLNKACNKYLSFTRPDITFVVNQASQAMHSQTRSHLISAKRILRYLADSDWAGCPTTRRSTIGFCVLLGANLLSWSSKKQPTVSWSSTKAEYRALPSAAAEVTWLQYLLKDLQVSLFAAPTALCDNISSKYSSYNPVLHSRSKHIAIDYHFVREKVLLGDLIVQHVPMQLQLDDMFTKPLSTAKFRNAISNLRLLTLAKIEGGCKPILVSAPIRLKSSDKPTSTSVGSGSRS
ncbi:transmembrane signal receptor [Lithospermum erythrorhizon]|uniref:Transmembrane signal receptor n=1 Tax=Lithospermum erythrorhizon TaxID=34254 RepID=A0AAV3R4I8_LITER